MTTLRYRAISFMSEAVEGTDVIAGNPTVFFTTLGDAPRVNPVREGVESNGVKAIHSGSPHVMFNSHGDVNLSMELKGKSGAAGAAAVHAAVLKASGFKEVLTPATSAAYSLATYHTIADDCGPMTVYEQQYDATGQFRRYIARGVRGNLNFNLAENEQAIIDFVGEGLYNAPANLASGTAPGTYDASRAPLIVRSLTLTIGGTPYCVTAMEFGTNWSVERITGACGPDSSKGTRLVRGDASRPGGSLTFNDVTLFAQILAAYGTDAVYALSATLSNGTDTVVISGRIQFGMYDRGGGNITEYSVPFFFLPDSGNDDIVITFT
jgi:hypothetical protein